MKHNKTIIKNNNKKQQNETLRDAVICQALLIVQFEIEKER